MANIISKILFRKGSTSDRSQIILDGGEPGWDSQLNELFVGNGAVSGGVPVMIGVDTGSFQLYNDGVDSTPKIIKYNTTTYPTNIVASGDIHGNNMYCTNISIQSMSPTGDSLSISKGLSISSLTASGPVIFEDTGYTTLDFVVRNNSSFTKTVNFHDSIYVTDAVNCKSMSTDIIVSQRSAGVSLLGNNVTNPGLKITNNTGEGARIITSSINDDVLKLYNENTSPGANGLLCINAPVALSSTSFNYIKCYDSSDSPFVVSNNGVTIKTRTNESGLTLETVVSGQETDMIKVTFAENAQLSTSLANNNIINCIDSVANSVFNVTPQGILSLANWSNAGGTAQIDVKSILGDESFVRYNVGGANTNEKYIRAGAFVDASDNSTFEIQALSGSGTGAELSLSVAFDHLGGNLYPGTDLTQDLGKSDAQWGTVYCDTINAASGATGVIDTAGSHIITVVDGIITNIA